MVSHKSQTAAGIQRRTEGSFNDTDLGSGRIDTGECTPIVDNESGTDHVRTSVHRTGLIERQVGSTSTTSRPKTKATYD